MSQNFRVDKIGLVNRDKKISFKFNGKSYFGYEGDTLASALIANGVHLIGRSFKYHRPRGFFGSGVDEPYAIVQLYRNKETDPNVRATEQELFEGLYVNCGWCYGGYKATPASGWTFAHTIAQDKVHELNAGYSLNRFHTGHLIDEKGLGTKTWIS